MGETSIVTGPSAINIDLEGRSALVTGAASGIGRACAGRLARAGASVTVVDLNVDAARKVAEKFGGKAVQADLSNYEKLDGLEVDAEIVVNNAGLQHVAAVEEFPPERFSMILRVMLEAPFRIVQKALPRMYEKGGDSSSTSPVFTACAPRLTSLPTYRPSAASRASPRL